MFSEFKGELRNPKKEPEITIIKEYCDHTSCKTNGEVVIHDEAILDLYAILGAVEFGRFHYKRYDELTEKWSKLRSLIEDNHIICKKEEKDD